MKNIADIPQNEAYNTKRTTVVNFKNIYIVHTVYNVDILFQ